MITPLENAPRGVLALKLGGTVLKDDVETASQRWRDNPGAKGKVVLMVDPEFDGYDAEIVRAFRHLEGDHDITAIAIMAENGVSPLTQGELANVTQADVRIFRPAELAAAYHWLS